MHALGRSDVVHTAIFVHCNRAWLHQHKFLMEL